MVDGFKKLNIFVDFVFCPNLRRVKVASLLTFGISEQDKSATDTLRQLLKSGHSAIIGIKGIVFTHGNLANS